MNKREEKGGRLEMAHTPSRAESLKDRRVCQNRHTLFCFIRQLSHTKSRLSAAKVDKRPVCGKDKNLVHNNVLVYNFIEVFLTPGNKFGKDRHE